jgi:glycosyltransferase involved in cell wall biosynthesis
MNNNYSVIIPTKDRYNDLSACLKSILKQTLPPKEIIIVYADIKKDIKSNINKVISNLKNPDGIEIITIASKPGLTIQKNKGVVASRTSILFFFDDDVIIFNNFCEEIVSTFNKYTNINIGGIAGMIVNPSKRSSLQAINNPINKQFFQFMKNVIYRIISTIFFLPIQKDGTFRASGHKTWPALNRSSDIIFVESLPGGITAYKKAIFEEYLFDEILSNNGPYQDPLYQGGYGPLEDVDFSYRVSRKYQNMLLKTAKCQHFSKVIIQKQQYYFNRTRFQTYFYLYFKNSPKKLINQISFYLSILGLLLETLFPPNFKNKFKGAMDGILIAKGYNIETK